MPCKASEFCMDGGKELVMEGDSVSESWEEEFSDLLTLKQARKVGRNSRMKQGGKEGGEGRRNDVRMLGRWGGMQ